MPTLSSFGFEQACAWSLQTTHRCCSKGLRPKLVESTHCRRKGQTAFPFVHFLDATIKHHQNRDMVNSLSGVGWLVGKGKIPKGLRNGLIFPVDFWKDNARPLYTSSRGRRGGVGEPSQLGWCWGVE